MQRVQCSNGAPVLSMNLSMSYAQSIRRIRRGMGLLVRSTAFSFSDPVFTAVKRKAYPELELAVGSFPYSSLAPPTTDERAAVTDSIDLYRHCGIQG